MATIKEIKKFYRRNTKLIITVAAAILIIAAYVSGELGHTQLSSVLWVLAAIVGGFEIAKSAIVQLRYKVLGIQALVTIAAVGAILIGEYWEAAVVVFLFELGGYLEALTIDRTRNALRALMSLAPTTASVRRGNDIVVVAPGRGKAWRDRGRKSGRKDSRRRCGR